MRITKTRSESFDGTTDDSWHIIFSLGITEIARNILHTSEIPAYLFDLRGRLTNFRHVLTFAELPPDERCFLSRINSFFKITLIGHTLPGETHIFSKTHLQLISATNFAKLILEAAPRIAKNRCSLKIDVLAEKADQSIIHNGVVRPSFSQRLCQAFLEKGILTEVNIFKADADGNVIIV